MTQHFPIMVPGTTPNGKIEVTAPFDGALISTIDTGGAEAVEQALATADTLYRDRNNWLTAEKRIEVLNKTAEIMQSRFDELAIEAAREGGKPLVDSKVEVTRAIDGIKNCIEVLRTEHGEEIPMQKNAASMNRLAFTTHEPIGVVVALSAFNHPLNLAVHQVGPAIAAGCPVIIKPASDTPLSCMRLIAILREAGLPEEWCQGLITSDNEVTSQMVSDPRVGFFSFIGSAKVGWMPPGSHPAQGVHSNTVVLHRLSLQKTPISKEPYRCYQKPASTMQDRCVFPCSASMHMNPSRANWPHASPRLAAR
jgi:acyl-CoA reductase-like NAD-dependent aldehyde dehydrogenase